MLILDSLPAYAAYVDAQQRLRFVNQTFEAGFGLPRQQIVGRHLADLLGPIAYEEVRRHIEAALAGRVVSHETLLHLPGGREQWHDARMTPDLDDHGQVRGFVVFVNDVTLRRQAEEALRQSEAQARDRLAELEHVYATTPIGIALHDTDLRILRISERLAAMDGLPVANHIGRTVHEILPDVARVVEPVLRQVITTGEPVLDVELETSTPARPWIAALVSFHPLKSPDGTVRAVSVGVQDISAKKRAEQALQRNHNLLSGMIEGTSDVVFVKGADGRYLMMNSAAARIVGRAPSEILGRSDAELFPPELAERFQADDRRVVAGEEVQEIEQIVPAGGEPRIFMTKKSAWVDEQGRIVGIIGIARDITEREWAEEQLRRLQAQNVYLREEVYTEYEFEDIVGGSRLIRNVLQAVKQVAETDSTVLITGETGTGKELVARAIHERSRRRDQLLVTVNCAALPSGLIESELFGHEKGAFTGALSRKIGRFEAADGGTIFLDEIGDLPLELQAKLLRVLQEGEFERVGGTQKLRTDVRVIAATNRELARDVETQRFREDLYYRLNVFPIHVPPLRERKEDISPLAQHFVIKHANRLGRRIDSISQPAMKALMAHSWPGNVRELQNVLERAMIISRSPVLELGEWPPVTVLGAETVHSVALENVERSHIMEVLEAARWRISGPSGAAMKLGLKPTTLHARMKKLGIRRPS